MVVEARGLPGFANDAVEPAVRTRQTFRNDDSLRAAIGPLKRFDHWDPKADAILFLGSCETLLGQMPAGSAQLIVTSPPYNIGKVYETRAPLMDYIEAQRRIIEESVRVLADGGSICWQVGNHIDDGEVFPLDAVLYPVFKDLGLKLRNRIVWHFEHGLHATKRLSGRHETILWFTKGDDYRFDVDPIRVPQKYPNKKAFKGPNRGELTGNPLGKSPGDVWVIPNVKSNHVEKTEHPCQFPVELIERLVLSMTEPGDLVVDPFGGVGSSVLAAVLNGRRAAMAEIMPEYLRVAAERLDAAEAGTLRVRPMTRAVYQPPGTVEEPDDEEQPQQLPLPATVTILPRSRPQPSLGLFGRLRHGLAAMLAR
ncbi:MAG TPA: site-specific DNA-methyltransferase [Candidatus Limnocylindrales bacterium]|nr:site-specific DNA-methyltransferase [Candidatus Limnocylindrales bacterium]